MCCDGAESLCDEPLPLNVIFVVVDAGLCRKNRVSTPPLFATFDTAAEHGIDVVAAVMAVADVVLSRYAPA